LGKPGILSSLERYEEASECTDKATEGGIFVWANRGIAVE